MKRQLEITTFVNHPAKKLKVSVQYDDAELSGVHDKITIDIGVVRYMQTRMAICTTRKPNVKFLNGSRRMAT